MYNEQAWSVSEPLRKKEGLRLLWWIKYRSHEEEALRGHQITKHSASRQHQTRPIEAILATWNPFPHSNCHCTHLPHLKIAGRNINNLGHADDTPPMVESKEELKTLLMKLKEESEKAGWRLNIQKTKITASDPITSWEIYGETVETVSDFFGGGLQNHCRWWLQPWN